MIMRTIVLISVRTDENVCESGEEEDRGDGRSKQSHECVLTTT